MSRAIQIQINILNKDIDKLGKDCEAVAEKKRRESNPQEENNLQLQLDSITKQIEEKEQKIKELEKKAEENNDIHQKLRNLLMPYEKEIFPSIKKAYRDCSPDDWPSSSLDNVENILVELKNMSSGNSKNGAIEQFIAHLVIVTRETHLAISQNLQQWGEENIQEFSNLLTVNQAKKNAQPYLIVEIRRSEQHSVIHPNKEDCYLVYAWLIYDSNSYSYKSGSGCKQLSYPSNMKEAVTFNEIPTLLKDFLNQLGDYSSNKLTIEIFLPFDLLNKAVDMWEIPNENEWELPLKLANQYKVVIRSSERLLPNYRYKGSWKEKWETLQKIIKNTVCSAFVLWNNDDDLKKLYGELCKENIIGLKLLKLPVKKEGERSVFAYILSTAIPVALWLRRDLSIKCYDQIDRLRNCCIDQLAETVQEKRIAAFSEPEDSHIGHHLSLLWEDPYRLPPNIDYSG